MLHRLVTRRSTTGIGQQNGEHKAALHYDTCGVGNDDIGWDRRGWVILIKSSSMQSESLERLVEVLGSIEIVAARILVTETENRVLAFH